mgnify:CR=1 FL=1
MCFVRTLQWFYEMVFCWDRFKHKSVAALLCRNSQKRLQKIPKELWANDNVTGGRRTDAAPEMEMKI